MSEDSLTASQCRAARALLAVTQKELADWSGVSKPTIADFERGERSPQRRTLKDLRAAFEARGVRFSADDSGGVGVFLAGNAATGEAPAGGAATGDTPATDPPAPDS